jgi:hypothetical protein
MNVAEAYGRRTDLDFARGLRSRSNFLLDLFMHLARAPHFAVTNHDLEFELDSGQ